MLAHVVARLVPQVDALVVCGRSWADLPMLPDRPEPGLGPLGGLAADLPAAIQALRPWTQDPSERVRRFASECLRRSEEHTSELQSLMRISYAVFCLQKTN